MRPEYRPYAREAGRAVIPKLIGQKIREWKQNRREAGLGKPANLTARNGRF